MTIKEVSGQYGISQDTLRYYERVGMIPAVARTAAGNRDYGKEDLDWIRLVLCMRGAGLPIEGIRRYVELCQQGEDTIPDRLQLLKDQYQVLTSQRQQIDTMLERLEYKIGRYEKAVESGRLVWDEEPGDRPGKN